MDLIDKGILSDLTRNCRVTYQEMAGKYGISANAIRKRIHKLEDSGVIYEYGITLSPAMFDADYAFGVLYTDGSHDEQEFVERIGQNQFVSAASSYTGGIYLLIAEFRSMDELHRISSFLRSLEGVDQVELHALVIDTGNQVKLGQLALLVLKHLNADPKMPIVELAEKTGLTARRVRRIINELISGQGVRFRALLELGVADSIPFIARLVWDDSKTTHDKLLTWLNRSFQLPLWEVFISASEPTFFCLFTAGNLTETEAITREIRKNQHVKSIKVFVSIYHKYFPALGESKLLEMVGGVGP
ncbi:MAG: winged helix-turn-helix transcriptional regulator [Candidatus Thorarchaeota archaeon]|nr:MAG: winged helix-turn-helix transcriptional regulator [Candidatus Thorarchaeota archaeon]